MTTTDHKPQIRRAWRRHKAKQEWRKFARGPFPPSWSDEVYQRHMSRHRQTIAEKHGVYKPDRWTP